MTVLHFVLGLLLAQAAPPDAPGLSVQGFASHIQASLPQAMSGYSLVGARADGDLLVLTLDGSRGWRQRVTQETVEHDALQGLCGDGDFLSVLHASGLRVDRLEEGRDLQTGTVLRCRQAGSGQ